MQLSSNHYIRSLVKKIANKDTVAIRHPPSTVAYPHLAICSIPTAVLSVEAKSSGMTVLPNSIRDKGDLIVATDFGTIWFAYSANSSIGTALISRGPIKFAVFVSRVASSYGYKFTRSGIIFNDQVIAGRTEKQIFELLNLPFIDYEDRFNWPMVKKLIELKGDSFENAKSKKK